MRGWLEDPQRREETRSAFGCKNKELWTYSHAPLNQQLQWNRGSVLPFADGISFVRPCTRVLNEQLYTYHTVAHNSGLSGTDSTLQATYADGIRLDVSPRSPLKCHT